PGNFFAFAARLLASTSQSATTSTSGCVAIASRSTPPIPPKPTAAWRSLARPGRADRTPGPSASAEAPARKVRREMGGWIIVSSLANIDTRRAPGFSPAACFFQRKNSHVRMHGQAQPAGARDLERPHPAVRDRPFQAEVERQAAEPREEGPQPAAVRDHAEAARRVPTEQAVQPAEGPGLHQLEALAAGEEERRIGPELRVPAAHRGLRVAGHAAVVHLAQQLRMADRRREAEAAVQDEGR